MNVCVCECRVVVIYENDFNRGSCYTHTVVENGKQCMHTWCVILGEIADVCALCCDTTNNRNSGNSAYNTHKLSKITT